MGLVNKKLIVVAILVVLLAGFAASHSASAQTAPATPPTAPAGNDNTSWLSCFITSGNIVTCAIYVVALTATTIMSWLVELGAWITLLALSFSQTLLDSPAVKVGFSVTLAIANLGFVLAIIVIAIATIVRSQTYGVKQLLWKLVVAAIFVNFSLVIAGAILGFSDSLTNFFMKPFPGSTASQTADPSWRNRAFVEKLTEGLRPQKLIEKSGTLPEAAASWGFAAADAGIGCATGALTTGPVGCVGGAGIAVLVRMFTSLATGDGQFFTNLVNLVFAIVFTAAIAFTFMALAVMLMIRYVYLGFLLILMPLVWLLWIFPSFKSHWDKWWSNFIRWAFFAPAVVFFLYLALTVTQNKSEYLSKYAKTATVSGPGIGLGITAAQSEDYVQSVGESIMLLGLALGGLFAANALSITSASVAMGLAKSAGGAVQGYAVKQGKRGAGRLVPAKVKEKLETGGYRFMPKRMQAGIGGMLRGVKRAGGADQVAAEMSWARDLFQNDPEAAKRMLGSGLGIRGGVSTERGLALIRTMIDKNKLPGDQKIGNKSLDDLVKDEKFFKSWGSEALHRDLTLYQKGVRPQAAQAAEVLAANGEDASMTDEAGIVNGVKGETVRAIDLLRASLDKTTTTFEKGDWKGRNLNHMFSNETLTDPTEARLRVELLRSLARNKPQVIAGAMPKMSQESLQNLANLFQMGLNSEKNEVMKSGHSEEDKTILLNRLKKTKESFEKSMVRNALGLIWEGEYGEYEGPLRSSAEGSPEETKTT